MIHKKIVHHLLPHFFVERDFALSSGQAHRFHHRAHALSLFSLFAYSQLVLVLVVGLYVVKLKAPNILGTVTFSGDQIISLTNAKRAENGLGALTYNPLLAQAASAKAANMHAEDYWAHFSPSGKTPWQFITAAGYKYVFAGENLARDFDDPGSVVNAWMNSPSHRDNILDKNFKEIGVAVTSGKLTGHEGILVVQMFGAGVAGQNTQQAAAKPSVASPVASPKGESTISAKEASVAASPESSEAAVPLTEEVVNVPPSEGNPTVLATRQFSIAKGVSLALVGFIFVLFLLEVVITFKREHVHIRSGVIAHLAILGFVLFALWYAVGGAIL